MKKIITTVLSVCLSFIAHGATNITTATVSGTWTAAGSPYKVFNNISISAGSTLTIQPGVEVIFQGYYKINVAGSLKAVGTSALPISFHVGDTTGWCTSDSVGGWYGMVIGGGLSSEMDSVKLNYCNLADIKGYLWIANKTMCMYNCNYFHNRGQIFTSSITSNIFEMSNCNVYDNNGTAIVANRGVQHFHDNKIYNNSGNSVFNIGSQDVAAVFERNDVYNNITVDGTIVCWYNVVVRKNRIYNNRNDDSPALMCIGTADIDGNIFCNNYHTSGSCGYVDGGGAIQVSSNTSSIPPANISYIIRNNVIANNYSSYQGGGIRVYDSKVTIVNNQIVNNTSPLGGAICILNDTFGSVSYPVVVKNNIINGNVSNASTGDPSVIAGMSCYAANFTFEHNYTQHPSAKVFAKMNGFAKAGDTTTNIIGTMPGFIDPTITASYTESAIARNFGLVVASPCVDEGDTSGCFIAGTDQAGNPRIYGAAIDIGAREYRPAGLEDISTVFATQSIQAYPNPAANILIISVAESKGRVTMVDILGKQVLETPVDTKIASFDVSSLPRGIYMAIWRHDGKQDIQKVILE